jgi:hypothetical protein
MQEGPKVTVPSPDPEQVKELEEIRHAPMSAMSPFEPGPWPRILGGFGPWTTKDSGE